MNTTQVLSLTRLSEAMKAHWMAAKELERVIQNAKDSGLDIKSIIGKNDPYAGEYAGMERYRDQLYFWNIGTQESITALLKRQAQLDKWGTGDILASWLLECDEDDIAYLIDISMQLDIEFGDVVDYLESLEGIKLDADAFIAEMQHLLIRRANRVLNNGTEPDENDHYPVMLEEGRHYRLDSKIKNNCITLLRDNIRLSCGDRSDEIIEILEQWGNRGIPEGAEG